MHPLRTLGLLALILIVYSVFEVKGVSGSLGMLTGGNSFNIRLELFWVWKPDARTLSLLLHMLC
jgi:hypothetical protein